jgi:hypothetical protein
VSGTFHSHFQTSINTRKTLTTEIRVGNSNRKVEVGREQEEARKAREATPTAGPISTVGPQTLFEQNGYWVGARRVTGI